MSTWPLSIQRSLTNTDTRTQIQLKKIHTLMFGATKRELVTNYWIFWMELRASWSSMSSRQPSPCNPETLKLETLKGGRNGIGGKWRKACAGRVNCVDGIGMVGHTRQLVAPPPLNFPTRATSHNEVGEHPHGVLGFHAFVLTHCS